MSDARNPEIPDFAVHEQGGAHILAVGQGVELNAYKAPEFAARIRSTLADTACSRLVVDLSGASFVDSTALGKLVEGFFEAGELDKKFQIFTPQPRIQKLFEITGLAGVFDIVDSLPETD